MVYTLRPGPWAPFTATLMVALGFFGAGFCWAAWYARPNAELLTNAVLLSVAMLVMFAYLARRALRPRTTAVIDTTAGTLWTFPVSGAPISAGVSHALGTHVRLTGRHRNDRISVLKIDGPAVGPELARSGFLIRNHLIDDELRRMIDWDPEGASAGKNQAAR